MKDYYIQIAKEACAYVHRICIHGSANRNNGATLDSKMMAEVMLSIEKKDLDMQVQHILNNPDLSEDQKDLHIIQLLADVAHRAKAGNCQEMAALAFLFLREKGIHRLEMVHNPIHTFLIIGRDPQTSIQHYETWNKETVVCDPWSRDIYMSKNRLFFTNSMVYSPHEVFGFESEDLHIGYALKEMPSLTPETVTDLHANHLS